MMTQGACAAGQPEADSPMLGFDGPLEYRQHISKSVKSWLLAAESTRRAMLLSRCTGLDRDFPRRPSPRMVHLIDVSSAWLFGEALPGFDRNELAAVAPEGVTTVLHHIATDEQLESWSRFRRSPEGRRALEVASVKSSLGDLPMWLVDTTSGVSWAWPLARIRMLADELRLRPALDATFSDVIPGSEQWLASLGSTPGQEPGSEEWVDLVLSAAANDRLADSFREHLSVTDAAALALLERDEVYARWARVWPAFGKFLTPSVQSLMSAQGRQTVAEFCSAVDARQCEPSTQFAQWLDQYRNRLTALAADGYVDKSIRRIVRQMAESGCP